LSQGIAPHGAWAPNTRRLPITGTCREVFARLCSVWSSLLSNMTVFCESASFVKNDVKYPFAIDMASLEDAP
jgi:hypothetical protein